LSDIQQWINNIPKLEFYLKDLLEYDLQLSWDSPYRTGGWTPREIVHHIYDCDLNFFVRIKATIAENTPTIAPFDENQWAIQQDVYKIPIEDTILGIILIRKKMAAILNSLEFITYNKEHYHPSLEAYLPLWQLIQKIAWHGYHHYMQMALFFQNKKEYSLPKPAINN
jgi:hypothetical protein